MSYNNSFVPPPLPEFNNSYPANNVTDRINGNNLWAGILAFILAIFWSFVFIFLNVLFLNVWFGLIKYILAFVFALIMYIPAFVFALIAITTNPQKEYKWFQKPIWKYKNKAKGFGICAMSFLVVDLVFALVYSALFYSFGKGTTVYQSVVSSNSIESQSNIDNSMRPINNESDLRDGEIMITVDGRNYAQKLDFGYYSNSDTYSGFDRSNDFDEELSTFPYESDNGFYGATANKSNDYSYTYDDTSCFDCNNDKNDEVNNVTDTYTNVEITQNEIELEIGDMLIFGNYNWKVLDIKNNQALIITEYPIGQGQYNKEFTDVTWETSSLREYLNGKFYESFNSADQGKIIEVQNSNTSNKTFGTDGGNATKDKIFVLSVDEAKKYDICIPKYVGLNQIWWLRTPGDDSKFAVGVYDAGLINEKGYNVDGYAGVRPACWITIDQ